MPQICLSLTVAKGFDGGDASLVSGSLIVDGKASETKSYEIKFELSADSLEEAQAQGDAIAEAVGEAAGVSSDAISVVVTEVAARRLFRLLAGGSYTATVTIVGSGDTYSKVSAALSGPAGAAALMKALEAAGINIVPGSLQVNTSASLLAGPASNSDIIGVPIGVGVGVAALVALAALRVFQKRTGPSCALVSLVFEWRSVKRGREQGAVQCHGIAPPFPPDLTHNPHPQPAVPLKTKYTNPNKKSCSCHARRRRRVHLLLRELQQREGVKETSRKPTTRAHVHERSAQRAQRDGLILKATGFRIILSP